MTVYRISGDGLLTLARLAATSPDADPNIVLAIVMGCDREASDEPQSQSTGDSPNGWGTGLNDALDALETGAPKPAKPE